MSCPAPPAISDVPQPLKSIVPFLNAANQFEKRDPVIAYYCRVYAANLGIKVNDPGCKKVLLDLMLHLETFKKIHGPLNEGIGLVNQQHCFRKDNHFYFVPPSSQTGSRKLSSQSRFSIELLAIPER